MVVQFAHAATATLAGDEPPAVPTKYLVGHNREKKNSIFDYVHLSSSLLRKIRYGQSLDAVLEARSPWSHDELSMPQSSPSELGFKAPRSVRPATPSRVHATNQDQRSEVTLPVEGVIHYGRAIQLQATDGGFLAVDDDGSLFKLSKTQRSDSRTLLTLFPQDPLHVPSSKTRVSTGELCFLVLGAATINADHHVLYADSREIIEPPAALRDAVQSHRREHTSDGSRNRGDGPSVMTTARVPSTVWSFRSQPARDPCKQVLETGAMVQLTQGRRTLHYEIERIVKHKYTPIFSGGPETADPSEIDATSALPTASTPSTSTDAGGGPRQTKAATFTHVWLQQNDLPAQHNAAQPSRSTTRHKRWDNLWFIVDVATDRRLEQQRKHRLAVQEAEEEVEAERGEVPEDNDEGTRFRRQLPHREQLATTLESDKALSDHHKRASVMNARVFVGQRAGESQSRAAAIIVRFLRRISRREAERRAKYLIEQRIRRTGKHSGHDDESVNIQLSTMQKLRVLQCFKPAVYGSQRLQEPAASPSRRISGISLQGSKFPAQESNRLASMQRDLLYLGTSDFQHLRWNRHPPLHQDDVLRRQLHKPLATNLGTKQQQQHYHHVSRERERGQQLHVQLAMAHREKPPFHFGKHALSLPQRLQQQQRPHTAPGLPSPKG